MGERWLVDAMNVIGSRPDGWWRDRQEAIRRFVRAVDDHACSSGKSITVVLDKDPGDLPEAKCLDVVVARHRGPDAADHEIERLVQEDDEPGHLRIVTSDRRLIEQVTAFGAQVVPSSRFRRELDG